MRANESFNASPNCGVNVKIKDLTLASLRVIFTSTGDGLQLQHLASGARPKGN
jgi:hypothetical protein